MKKAIAKGILVTSIVTAQCFTACNSNTNGSSASDDTTTTKESSSTTVGGSLADAGQVPFPSNFADVTKPADNIKMPLEYAKAIAQMAYIWGWPLVNQFNRRDNITKAPYPALNGGVIPVAPMSRLAMLVDYIKPSQTFVACPNQDVVYGLAYGSLNREPVIIQVPDFGDRFWVYAMYDARSDQFAKMGKPYGTKPGFYLIAGPKWNGTLPNGVNGVIKSSTEMVNMIPRIFMDDTKEDRIAIQSVVNQVVLYPLAEFDGKMKTVDYSKLPSIGEAAKTGGGETKWVVPETFFDVLPAVLDSIAPLPGEEALYANFRQLLNAAARDPEIKKAIIAAAVEADKSFISSFFRWEHNGTPAGNNWNRSTNNATFGVDYFNRTSTAKSNFYDNKPDETQYFYTDIDSKGIQLNGKNNYSVTFAKDQTPPVNGFWSVTLYNEHHFFNPNVLNRFSLGTKNKNLKYNTDGSLTLYVGQKSPGSDKETNWLPAPAGSFSLYIRSYWGKPAILDKTWQPPAVIKY
jgi:hypothetical protein